MTSAVRLREDFSVAELRRWPSGRRPSARAGGFCRWLRSGTAWTEAGRRRSAGWTARRCLTGSIASTRRSGRPHRQLEGGSQASVPSLHPRLRRSNWLKLARLGLTSVAAMTLGITWGLARREAGRFWYHFEVALVEPNHRRTMADRHNRRPRLPARQDGVELRLELLVDGGRLRARMSFLCKRTRTLAGIGLASGQSRGPRAPDKIVRITLADAP
jgi:hypothetical protein